MGFLYFLPGFPAGVATTSDLDAVGLGHAHDDLGPRSLSGARFAESTPGLFVAAAVDVTGEANAVDLRYVPDEQDWRPGPLKDGKPLYHVGFWKDRRPTPDSLQRKKPLDGTPVTLLDGLQWTVPVAMARAAMVTLPLVMDLAPDGEWFGRVSPRYLNVCQAAAEAYDSLMDVYFGRTRTVVFSTAMRIVAVALGAAYRVGPAEIAALGLIGVDEVGDVFEAMCDWAGFKEGLDKRLGELRAAGPYSTGSGSPESSPDTNSPGATSPSTPSA